MVDYEAIFWLGSMAVTSAITIQVGLKILHESYTTAIKAKYALAMISAGDNPRKYRDVIQDAKIDGLAGFLIGGKRALFKAMRDGKNNS